ncbi:nuclear transport factor 2 family protein, partial [Aliarcobacter butzleri]|uniref:nuclear transport factor 2 family protein n=1 Tax=Aliarcobacter butzleri TaxID=28197 RepID=UPI003AF7B95A
FSMILTEQNPQMITELSNRIAALEAERAIRNVLARYMALCDQPCHDHQFPQLADLFSANAVWEGVGELYTQTFGKQVGVTDIV